MQNATFADEPGIWMVSSGDRLAFRHFLSEALLYAYERSTQTTAMPKIAQIGQNRELDSSAIMQGWRDLGLRLPYRR